MRTRPGLLAVVSLTLLPAVATPQPFRTLKRFSILANPAGLVQTTDGALYGAAVGGACGGGALYRARFDGTRWTREVVASFTLDEASAFISPVLVANPGGGLYVVAENDLGRRRLFKFDVEGTRLRRSLLA